MFKNRRSGQAVVEAALMMPWIAFLFVGILDFGFYSYAAICTQNAARAAAVLASKDPTAIGGTTPCTSALGELYRLPNVGASLTTCATSSDALTDSAPVAVWVDKLCNTGCTDVCADCPLNSTATSARATVVYLSVPMIPIPGVLMGRMTLGRVVEMRNSQ